MKLRTFRSMLLMIAGIFILGYFTSWWLPGIWVVVIAYVMKLSIMQGIITGGISFALVWLAMAFWMIGQDTAGIISKTGVLLGGLSLPLMMVVVLILALITGSLAGCLGSAIQIYANQRNTNRTNGNSAI